MTVCMTPRMGSQGAASEQRPTDSQLLSGAAEMTLRISGPGHDGRLVRIRSPKCTIGSAAGCTLRLRARGVLGLHCWILRGAGGTVIRRLSGAASINGAHFDEAMLAVGDRLNIGPVEMIVEEFGNAAPRQRIPAVVPLYDDNVLALEGELDQALDQIQRLEGESRQGFESSIMAAERADQLRDALTATSQQLEDVCGELAAAQETIDRQASELATTNEQLTAIHGQLAATNKTVERQANEIAGAQQTINDRSSELSKERAKSTAMHKSEQGGEEAIERLRAELTNVKSECDARTTELRQIQEAVEAERTCWVSELAALTRERDEHSREVDVLKAKLATNAAEMTAVIHQQSTNAAAEAQLSELQQQVIKLRSETANSKRLLEEALADASVLRQQLKDRADVQDRMDELSAGLKTKCRELGQAQAEGMAIRQQLQDQTNVQSRVDELSAGLKVKCRELEEAQADITALRQQLKNEASAQNRMDELSAGLEIKCRELEQAQADMTDLRQQLQDQADAQVRMDQVINELEIKGRELGQAQQDITSLKSQAAGAVEVDQRAAAVERQQAELQDRESQIAESLKTLEERQAMLSMEAEQLAMVKQALTDKEQRLSEAALQIEQAQAAVLSQQAKSSEANQQADEPQPQAAEIAGRMAELDALLEQLVEQRAALAGRETDIGHRESTFEERWGELNRQAEQFQARREQLDEREAQLAEREAAAIRAAIEAEPRGAANGNNGQTMCVEMSQFADAANIEGGEPNADELYKTIVAGSGPLSASGRSPLMASLLSPEDESPIEQSSDSVEVNSVLGRLADAGVLRQDDHCDRPMMTEPAAVIPEPRAGFVAESFPPPTPPRIPKTPASDAEESIESYMERLMQRVRGDSIDLPAAPTQTAVKPMRLSPSTATVEDVGSTLVTVVRPQSGPEIDPTAQEVAPRRPVPNAMTNLAAMREVANSAAHAAINQSVRSKASKGAQRKLWGATFALGGSAVLAYFSWEAGSTPGMAGAAVGCTIAAYWMFGAARGFLGLTRAKPEQEV